MPRAKVQTVVKVEPIDMRTALFHIEGTKPLGVARFSYKAQKAIQEAQEKGQAAKAKKTRDARDFEAEYEAAKYISEENWLGVNAACFRNALISVSRVAGLVMARVKFAVFTVADGVDKFDGTPLVKVIGEPEMWVAHVRNANGSFDLRSRVRWPRWKMDVKLEYDAGILTLEDLTNLLIRVGKQGGICEGRPDSKNGPGVEMGLFKVNLDPALEDDGEAKKVAA